jgi:thiol peroxidase
MTRAIKFKGSPLTLVGRNLKVGAIASDFRVSAQDLKEVRLSDFKDKIKILTSFPSLDTPVCDLQVKEFNKKAAGIATDVVIVGISKDLPFAQQRFCETFEIKNVTVVSDYKQSSFGINYGLLIKELNLLARSVLILDKNNVIRYIQVVEELTKQPDYAAVLSKLDEVIKTPALVVSGDLPGHCKPCEGGALPLAKEKIEELIAKANGWEVIEDKKITKEFNFKDFQEAKYFLDLVSLIAEEQNHHPNFTLVYNRLKITCTTHAIGGLSENDFIIARIIEELNG